MADAYEVVKRWVPQGATVYDPWFNDGSCADVMRAAFGGCTVVHENRDALTWFPERCDVIVGNPPFSAKYFWLQWLIDTGKPFAVLLPMSTLVALPLRAVRGHEGLQLVLASRRICYARPQGRVRPAFDSCWICMGLDMRAGVQWGP